MITRTFLHLIILLKIASSPCGSRAGAVFFSFLRHTKIAKNMLDSADKKSLFKINNILRTLVWSTLKLSGLFLSILK